MVTPTQRFNEYGPFIPFDRPILPITAGIFDTPNLAVCVNEEWIPVVVGALKSLLDEATWKTDDPDEAANMCEQVDQLISSWDVCGTSLVQPDWHMNIFVTDGFADFYVEVPNHDDTTQVANFTVFTGQVRNTAEPPEPLHFYIQFYTNSGEDPCGGNIVDLHFECNDISDSIELGVTDCLDVLTTWDGFGSVNLNDVYPSEGIHAIKEIEVLTSATLMTFYLRGVDLVQCTVS